MGDSGEFDLHAVRDLMTFDYIPSPRTVLRDVRKLEPGSRFEWSFGDREPAIERYWTPPVADPAAFAPDEQEVEQLLERAVKRQMISDVPIGAFLSGGIDSSLSRIRRSFRRTGEHVPVAFSEGGVENLDRPAASPSVQQRSHELRGKT